MNDEKKERKQEKRSPQHIRVNTIGRPTPERIVKVLLYLESLVKDAA